MTGAATIHYRRRGPRIAFCSLPIASRWLAVQTGRWVELLVWRVPLVLGPGFAEPVGGKQQLSDAREKSS